MSDSTISNNTASSQIIFNYLSLADGGGGIYNNAMLTLANSTISNNNAAGHVSSGGGIRNKGGKASSTLCTIYGNRAINDGGGISLQDDPDAQSVSEVNLSNSIIAANLAQQEPAISGKLKTRSHNLIQDSTGASFLGPQEPYSTDRQIKQLSDLHIDAVLRKNGGPTLTYALLLGSPAIDAIPLQDCQVTDIFNSQSRMYTDQRGGKRPDENEPTCDIGAYEYVASPTLF